MPQTVFTYWEQSISRLRGGFHRNEEAITVELLSKGGSKAWAEKGFPVAAWVIVRALEQLLLQILLYVPTGRPVGDASADCDCLHGKGGVGKKHLCGGFYFIGRWPRGDG